MLIMGCLAVFHSLIFLLDYHPWGENDFKILEHGSKFFILFNVPSQPNNSSRYFLRQQHFDEKHLLLFILRNISPKYLRIGHNEHLGKIYGFLRRSGMLRGKFEHLFLKYAFLLPRPKARR